MAPPIFNKPSKRAIKGLWIWDTQKNIDNFIKKEIKGVKPAEDEKVVIEDKEKKDINLFTENNSLVVFIKRPVLLFLSEVKTKIKPILTKT